MSAPTLLSANNYYYYRGGAETVFLEHNRMFESAQTLSGESLQLKAEVGKFLDRVRAA